MWVHTRYTNSTRGSGLCTLYFSHTRWELPWQLGSLLLCLCDIIWVPINSRLCWFNKPPSSSSSTSTWQSAVSVGLTCWQIAARRLCRHRVSRVGLSAAGQCSECQTWPFQCHHAQTRQGLPHTYMLPAHTTTDKIKCCHHSIKSK